MGKRERVVLKALIVNCCVMFVLSVVAVVLYRFKIYIHDDENKMFVFSIVSISTFMTLCFLTIVYNSAVRDNTKS